MSSSTQRNDEFIPSREDALLATEALTALSPLYQRDQLPDSLSIEQVSMPAGVFRLLVEVLTQTAQGHAITIIPSTKEFTTQEAADVLNVSRPFVIKLLEEGKIPFHRVGRHRRIKASDLLSYKRKSEVARSKAFEELAKIAQDTDMGYE